MATPSSGFRISVQPVSLNMASNILELSRTVPFLEFTPSDFAREQKAKNILRRFGYYNLLGSS